MTKPKLTEVERLKAALRASRKAARTASRELADETAKRCNLERSLNKAAADLESAAATVAELWRHVDSFRRMCVLAVKLQQTPDATMRSKITGEVLKQADVPAHIEQHGHPNAGAAATLNGLQHAALRARHSVSYGY